MSKDNINFTKRSLLHDKQQEIKFFYGVEFKKQKHKYITQLGCARIRNEGSLILS